MEDKIVDYLIKEKRITGYTARVLYKRMSRHADICNEFLNWLTNGAFDCARPISIKGYTASKIAEMNNSLDAFGVYDFMITLRENPDKADEYIENGFKTK
jgi:hypothetical protein